MRGIHRGMLCVTAVLFFFCGAAPHLKIHRNSNDHTYTLFAKLDSHGTTSLVQAGPRLPEDMDLYGWYSASVHCHLCLFSWYIVADARRSVAVPKWQKWGFALLCGSALATTLLFLFLADQFSAQGISHGFFDKTTYSGHTVGLRGSGAHAFQYAPLAVCITLYNRPNRVTL